MCGDYQGRVWKLIHRAFGLPQHLLVALSVSTSPIAALAFVATCSVAALAPLRCFGAPGGFELAVGGDADSTRLKLELLACENMDAVSTGLACEYRYAVEFRIRGKLIATGTDPSARMRIDEHEYGDGAKVLGTMSLAIRNDNTFVAFRPISFPDREAKRVYATPMTYFGNQTELITVGAKGEPIFVAPQKGRVRGQPFDCFVPFPPTLKQIVFSDDASKTPDGGPLTQIIPAKIRQDAIPFESDPDNMKSLTIIETGYVDPTRTVGYDRSRKIGMRKISCYDPMQGYMPVRVMFIKNERPWRDVRISWLRSGENWIPRNLRIEDWGVKPEETTRSRLVTVTELELIPASVRVGSAVTASELTPPTIPESLRQKMAGPVRQPEAAAATASRDQATGPWWSTSPLYLTCVSVILVVLALAAYHRRRAGHLG